MHSSACMYLHEHCYCHSYVATVTGNYMQMMNILQPIAPDVLECLTHLFDYYLYAVS